MARDFNGTSDTANHTAAVVTAMPLTMACWFNSDSSVAAQVLLRIDDTATGVEVWNLQARGDAPGDKIYAATNDGSGSVQAATSTGYTVGQWHHACGVFTSSTSRKAYIDGGSVGSNTTTRSPTGVDNTRIGSSTSSSYTDGRIAEVAIWNIDLNAQDIKKLAAGYSPLFVQPDNLKAYWPFLGYSSPEMDRVGGYNMTLTGTIVADHPRIIYPSRPKYFLPLAAGSGINLSAIRSPTTYSAGGGTEITVTLTLDPDPVA